MMYNIYYLQRDGLRTSQQELEDKISIHKNMVQSITT